MNEFSAAILPDNTGVEIDGEIVSLADAGIVLEDLSINPADDSSSRLDQAYDADFARRNAKLVEVSRTVAQRNRVHGQLQQAINGNNRFGATHTLEDRKSYLTETARGLARQACGACAFADFCATGPDKLVTILDDPKVRNRFKPRVSRPSNNEFCGTNLQPGKIPHNVA